MKRGSAITWPPIFINVGQTSESCNPIIVPVTTPTATVIVYPFDQRFANAIYLGSFFLIPKNSAIANINGIPTPIVAKII